MYFQVRWGYLVNAGREPFGIPCISCEHRHKILRTAINCYYSQFGADNSYPGGLSLVVVNGSQWRTVDIYPEMQEHTKVGDTTAEQYWQEKMADEKLDMERQLQYESEL